MPFVCAFRGMAVHVLVGGLSQCLRRVLCGARRVVVPHLDRAIYRQAPDASVHGSAAMLTACVALCCSVPFC